MTKEKVFEDLGLLSGNNDDKTLKYYTALNEYIGNTMGSSLFKFRNFSVFTPRQVISDFLVRYELFKLIKNVPGNVLEFGVYFGQGLFSYAHFSAILEPYYINREIIGFDTFEGFPGISEQDKLGIEEHVKKGGLKADCYDSLMEGINLFDNNRYLGHLPKIKLVKGDVTKGLDEFIHKNPHILVALLYLDLDLYKPTKTVLSKLLNRVPKGGVVAFDQLNHKSFPGETIALLEEVGCDRYKLQKFEFCSRISYFIKE